MFRLNTDEMKELLRLYPQMPIQVKNLEAALSSHDIDGTIYSNSVSQVVSGMPHGGISSDKTQMVALEYEKALQAEDAAIRAALAAFKNAISQIETALDGFPKEDRDTIRMLYIEGNSPVDVYGYLNRTYNIYSDGSRRRKARAALNRMTSMLYITEKDFDIIKKEGRL